MIDDLYQEIISIMAGSPAISVTWKTPSLKPRDSIRCAETGLTVELKLENDIVKDAKFHRRGVRDFGGRGIADDRNAEGQEPRGRRKDVRAVPSTADQRRRVTGRSGQAGRVFRAFANFRRA